VQPFSALGKNLISVVAYLDHHARDALDVFGRHIGVKKIAHRVNEDHAWRLPSAGLIQFLGNEPKIKSLFIGVTRDTPETFSKRLGVAVLAAWTDFCAAANRIPSCIGPLD
jgi:hypothetical protein